MDFGIRGTVDATAEPLALVPLTEFDTGPVNIHDSEASSGAGNSTLRRQGDVLVTCLLEKFCSLYDRNPERSKRLFYNICRQLSKMGVISSVSALEALAPARLAYHDAFTALLQQASTALGGANTDGSVIACYTPFGVPSGGVRHRYRVEFDEVRRIGKGGFGAVFEARHKLDNSRYAVKKVAMGSSSYDSIKVLREVTTLAKLDHPNVCRYNAAWVEPSDVPPGPCACRDVSAEDGCSSASASASVPFSHPNANAGVSTARPGLRLWPSSSAASVANGASSSAPGDGDGEGDGHEPGCPASAPLVTIFIQMQLCERSLHDWLHERNFVQRCEVRCASPAAVLPLFAQILQGVRYIHDQGVVHRDLKPQNIFLLSAPDGGDGERGLLCKIGDFGLARGVSAGAPSRGSATPPADHVLAHRLHALHLDGPTVGVGTSTYAAPEQLQGGVACTDKADMYSLGIILLELLVAPSTQMERVVMLNALRGDACLPELLLTSDHAKEAATILLLTARRPDDRPSAAALLSGDSSALFSDVELPAAPVPLVSPAVLLVQKDALILAQAIELQTLRSQLANCCCDAAKTQ